MKPLNVVIFVAAMTLLCGIFSVIENGYGIYVTHNSIEILKPNEQEMNRLNEFLDSRYRQVIQAVLLILTQAGIIFLVRKVKRRATS